MLLPIVNQSRTVYTPSAATIPPPANPSSILASGISPARRSDSPASQVTSDKALTITATPHPGIQLLGALWRSPNRCHQIGVRDRQFKNIPVNGVTEAVRLALHLSDAGSDTYLACAEYRTPDNRTADNVSGALGLWMDIDCGEEKAAGGKGYLTEDDALLALKKFCIDTGLPDPTHIVSSGGGLHVYWVRIPVNVTADSGRT